MFLPRVCELGLLKHDPESNILAAFPYPVRRSLISAILPTLLPSAAAPAPAPGGSGGVGGAAAAAAQSPTNGGAPAGVELRSQYHVRWVMEVVGAGLSLPAEDWPLAAQSAAVYARWLLDSSARPAGVVEEGLQHQSFYQIIFKHLSLLFAPRNSAARSNQAAPPAAGPAGAPAFAAALTALDDVKLGCVNAANAAGPAGSAAAPEAPAEQPQGPLAGHIDLCKSILKVLTAASRCPRLGFTEETWTVLLKCLLGSVDGLLRGCGPAEVGSPDGSAKMAEDLCEHLLRALFEIWLRSQTSDVTMWEQLKACFASWTHRAPVIRQWNAASLSLTNRVIRLLYGPGEGAEAVQITVNGVHTQLDLPAEFVLAAWHRVIYMIGDPIALPSANFAAAINGISRLVDTLLSIGRPLPPLVAKETPENVEPLDGNTILHMFGSWLFQACSARRSRPDSDYQAGQAEAIGVVCRIFCRPQRRNRFLVTYIEQFYCALCEGLRTNTCLPTILLNSTGLFAADLEGIRLLVPDFIAALSRVLPKPASGLGQFGSDELCFAALRVAATMLSVPNILERISLRPGWDATLRGYTSNSYPSVAAVDSVRTEEAEKLQRTVKTLYSEEDLAKSGPNEEEGGSQRFEALKSVLLELLLSTLRADASPRNTRYLLHLLNVYVVEEVSHCPAVVGVVIGVVRDKILALSASCPEVCMTAFCLLADFVDLYDYVMRESKRCVRDLVTSLCDFVNGLLRPNLGAHQSQLAIAAMECILRWVIAGNWILNDAACQSAVLRTLCRGICISELRENGEEQPAVAEKKRRNPVDKLLFGSRRAEPPAASPAGNAAAQAQAQPRAEEQAVMQVANICLLQYVNQLGNFPPFWADALGASRISTLWDDDVKVARRTLRARGAAAPSAGTSSRGLGDVRYFLTPQNVILGFLELPRRQLRPCAGCGGGGGDASAAARGQAKDGPRGCSRCCCSAGVPQVVVVARHAHGKHSWAAEMCYLGHRGCIEQALAEIDEGPAGCPDPAPAAPRPGSGAAAAPRGTFGRPEGARVPRYRLLYPARAGNMVPTVQEVLAYGQGTAAAYRNVNDSVVKQKASEANIVWQERSDRACNAAHPPSAREAESANPSTFRIFLSSLGILHPDQLLRLTPLPVTSGLLDDLEKLDDIKERECLTAAVLYARSGEEDWQNILLCPDGVSSEFQSFVRSLGWPIVVADHQGFRGNLTPDVCEAAPYYANPAYELVFHVPYLTRRAKEVFPAASAAAAAAGDDSGRQARKLAVDAAVDLCRDDHVAVVWLEDTRKFEHIPQKFAAAGGPPEGAGSAAAAAGAAPASPAERRRPMRASIWLFVQPIRGADGLYLVRMVLRANLTDTLVFGPLVDKIIVSRHTLGRLVRNTVVSGNMACRRGRHEYLRNPHNARWNCISTLAFRHRVDRTLSEFYADLFSCK